MGEHHDYGHHPEQSYTDDASSEVHCARRLYGHQGKGEVDRGMEEEDDQQAPPRAVVGPGEQYRQGDDREREEGEWENRPAYLSGSCER